MEVVWEFLESSTIHGLFHITRAKSTIAKVVWAAMVVLSFVGAGFLINRSFGHWSNTPVSTSIHTMPITTAPFPRVTVCPPLGSNTALNYDLLLLSNVTLSKEDRQWLEEVIVSEIGVDPESELETEFLKNLVKSVSAVEFVQAIKNSWESFGPTTKKAAAKGVMDMYERVNVTGGNMPNFMNNLVTIDTMDMLEEVSFHPVHLINKGGVPMPSSFIPYCAFGTDMSIIGRRNNNFSFPICDSFIPTILDGQLCYEIDMKRFNVSNGIGKRAGLTIIVDKNYERSLNAKETKALGGGTVELVEKTHIPSVEKDIYSVRIHIDTLEPYSAYGAYSYLMTSVKEIQTSEKFSQLSDKERNCGLEKSMQDCMNFHYYDRPSACNCTPEEFHVVFGEDGPSCSALGLECWTKAAQKPPACMVPCNGLYADVEQIWEVNLNAHYTSLVT